MRICLVGIAVTFRREGMMVSLGQAAAKAVIGTIFRVCLNQHPIFTATTPP